MRHSFTQHSRVKTRIHWEKVCAYKNPHTQTFFGHWGTSKKWSAAEDLIQGTGDWEWFPLLAICTGNRNVERGCRQRLAAWSGEESAYQEAGDY